MGEMIRGEATNAQLIHRLKVRLNEIRNETLFPSYFIRQVTH